ncbi:SLAP domain-containing protein [Ureibacillus sp. GCM10028918]|uniref:SLAP domain-containing protein n=1 Tax=Ureibacillus sp. GCM10028918 TaxID=3273429 RepID=UPI00360B7803
MQQLQFEASWDKALSAKDRLKIEGIFTETKNINHSDILFSPIREAINHEESLLVTVLIHNFTDYPFGIHHISLLYSVQGEAFAEGVFTQPALTVPSKVSMPWTFIFPKGSYRTQTAYENGQLGLI